MIWFGIIVDILLLWSIRVILKEKKELEKEIHELRKSNQELLNANYNLTQIAKNKF